MVDISKWNSAAASNTLSPPDGAPEGWDPADVNNVVREVMAAVRRQYEDPDFADLDHTPTFVTAISFTISGNHTARYATDRRIRADVGGTLLYGDIISQTATGGVTTTVIVTLDSGSLTSSLTGVALGILTPAGYPEFGQGDSTVSGDLAVSGALLAGSASISGDVVVTGAVRSGTLSISGVTAITGAASFGSTMTVTGKVTFKDALSVSGTIIAPQILLGADPTVSLGAATKQYADAGDFAVASQAEMESASAVGVTVTPGRQHFHPGMAKGWVKFDMTGAISASYNVTSVTDNGVGLFTVNWATDFSGADYAVVASVLQSADTVQRATQILLQTAGTVQVEVVSGAGNTEDSVTDIFVVAYGDH